MRKFFLVRELISTLKPVSRQVLLICLALFSFLVGHLPAQAVEVNEADWAYSVKPNDTFYGLYRQFLNNQSDIAQLSAYNRHKLSKRLLPGQVLQIPVAMLKKMPVQAQVLVASGEVVRLPLDQSSEQKVYKGDLLNQGDSLKTGKYSVTKLGFPDGSVVDVQQNSHIVIQSSYQYAGKLNYVVLLKLIRGRTEIGANPSHANGYIMQIQTPSAIAAVRGTTFRVRADSGVTMQETLSGRVALASMGKEVLLAQGYGSVAEKNKAPLPPIALPNKPNLSHLPTNIESADNLVSFTLKSQADADTWVSQLAKDAEFKQIISEQTIQTSTLDLGQLAEGQYFLRIRAQGSQGLQGEDALHVFSVKQILTPVVLPQLTLISPVADTVIPLAPTSFKWSPKSDAQQYMLQISRDIDFKDVVFEQSTLVNQLVIRQSFGRGQYFWRVAAISQGKPQMFSEVRKFTR